MTIERSYVIDVVVRDFDKTAESFSRILGREGYTMVPEADPSGQLVGIHFPVGGINALGVMALKEGPEAHPEHYISKFLASHGDGICILGHLVDSVDKQVQEFQDREVALATPEPTPYSDGRLIFAMPIHGTHFEFAEHHSHAVTELWRSRKAAAARPRVGDAYRVDIVVDDLEAATEEFSHFLGMSSIPASEDRGSGLRSVDFPIGGLETMSLLSLDGGEPGPIARAVAEFRSRSGEGPMILGFHVGDVDQVQGELQDLGVEFLLPAPIASGKGRSSFTRPVHGVTFEFTQR